jgi:hypothetical protein
VKLVQSGNYPWLGPVKFSAWFLEGGELNTFSKRVPWFVYAEVTWYETDGMNDEWRVGRLVHQAC